MIPEDLIRLIVYVVLIIIVPLIPAVIIFLVFPEAKVISWGPFKGQRVRMTGAFAGYFVLVLLISGFITAYTIGDPSINPPVHDTWTINGKIQCKDAPRNFHYRLAVISIIPPKQSLNDIDGSFTLENVRIPAQKGIQQCSINFYCERYIPATITFGQDTPIINYAKAYDIEVDESRKTINIRKPIVLEPDTAFQAQEDTKKGNVY